ncbi:L,D-transpeptidase [Spirulina sp. CCNP1310]|uniref:L,D-transpeptidase n=1 Tax=Spirulina sp. CCNP1310 TaxID=3110249 RepID=UPI002B218053|nr:L,D-transpeptidase [Spirulina sp. CCNP1310]MEA5421144.1 L,D-transpeptidase [Spirulina sp. CCNP1310]
MKYRVWLGAMFLGLTLAQPAAGKPEIILSAGVEIPALGSRGDFLPQADRLVLRLGDRLVDYYEGEMLVVSYPVAVGRAGWETPTGEFQVQQLVVNPVWQHPFTGAIVPPGPDNPLGARWIGFWSDGENFIGFHGTPDEQLIGQAVSHGCVRMRNRDIIALFDRVSVGTVVIVEP